MNMLVVDDDPEFTKLLARVAASVGWTAIQTHGPDGFREKFCSTPPDAAVIDLHLGATDGVELLRWLSTKRYQGSILIVSGFDDRVLSATENLGHSLGLNIAGVIHKPVRTDELTQTFENLRANIEPVTSERIDQAIARGEMQMHVQPVVEADTLKPVKVEALARWKHPTRGMLAPAVFIPVLERDPAAMDRFTLWAIREMMGRIDSLSASSSPLSASVNISAVNLGDLSLPDRVADVVRETGQNPARLTLEITESAATSDPTATVDILTRLRLKGFGLSLDDFGTGYSSLVALHRLPFTEIKVDKIFVDELPASREAATIIKTVADLARNIGLHCVAEGVESRAVGKQLHELGVGFLQGYAYARPVAMDEFVGAVNAGREIVKTVLVIDDNTSFLEIQRKVLEKAGYSVLTAKDGAIGLDLLRSNSVVAVITDIIMPGMEGIETIRAMRKSWPDLPIVAMSGGGRQGNVDFLTAAKAFGAKYVLHKPFRDYELLDAVRRAVGG